MRSPSDISAQPEISIIVPVWGDDILVRELVSRFQPHPVEMEWIIAAVEPSDALRELESQGWYTLVACPEPSRGSQMNAGARVAKGRLLCFHHADTEMTHVHFEALLCAARNAEVRGGAFHRAFDQRHAWMINFQRLAHILNTLAWPLFGDQSIFVKAELFRAMGGYADIPLMEDIEFSGRLRKAGKITLLNPPIVSSARRFRRIGNWKSSLMNFALIVCFYIGVQPRRLHEWYYRNRNPTEKAVE